MKKILFIIFSIILLIIFYRLGYSEGRNYESLVWINSLAEERIEIRKVKHVYLDQLAESLNGKTDKEKIEILNKDLMKCLIER